MKITVPRVVLGAVGVVSVAVLVAGSAVAAAPAAPPPAPAEAAVTNAPIYQPTVSETSFVAVTPCRVADTRSGGGALPRLSTRAFAVGGTTGFLPQGGRNGGCQIPATATSVVVTVTAVTPKGQGYLAAWPFGVARPTSSVVNFAVGTTVAGSSTVPLGAGGKINVYNGGVGTTQVLVDVAGYYVKPLAAFISPSGGTYAGSSRTLAATKISTGYYEVTFDQEVRNCAAVATPYYYSYFASTDAFASLTPDKVRVRVWSAANTPVDSYFSLQVSC